MILRVLLRIVVPDRARKDRLEAVEAVVDPLALEILSQAEAGLRQHFTDGEAFSGFRIEIEFTKRGGTPFLLPDLASLLAR